MPQLMEILEFLDPTGQIMVKRVPDFGDCEIKWGAQLTVRESQTAIFFRDGKALDVFGTGRHVLQTQNIPVITKLVTKLGYGTESPFRSEVYFLNMKLFPNLKWGTREPILFKDSEFQMIRLRSFGIFSIQISNPSLFLNKVVGTKGIYADTDIEDYLKSIILTQLTNVLGNQLKSVFELPKDFNQLSLIVRLSIQQYFDALGLKIHDFLISSISVPEEVQKMIDAKSGMSAIGDMDKFLKFKAAMALEASSNNSNGGASTGVGVGAGMGMGLMLPQMLASSLSIDKSQSNKTIDPLDKLKKLKELLDLGALSQEEYNEKKEKLLNEI